MAIFFLRSRSREFLSILADKVLLFFAVEKANEDFKYLVVPCPEAVFLAASKLKN